ncbi:MAG TPA: ATP phosphoribosyltransferase regulatory subunit [Nitrospiria bacterium]|nr:ATP phosphoribosyltransferase regulatory subunit [Nitrospiria bacterium]
MKPFKNQRSSTPRGVTSLLPEAAFRKRLIEGSILDTFSRWGYQEVITPVFEYLDVISIGLGEEFLERGYKFVDRSSGRLMLLRPDVTPQIARMVAMQMRDHPKPLRLSYSQNVFRHQDEHAGREREISQIGGELIGIEGPEADAEIISVAIESLKRLGIREFKIVIGHIGFFDEILSRTGIKEAARPEIHEAVLRKDTSRLKEILRREKIGSRGAGLVSEIPGLFGGSDILEKADRLVKGIGHVKGLKNLKEIFEILTSHGFKDYILIDLGEVRGMGYYTGMVFEIISEGIGYELGGGGRYDNLIGGFGFDCPSTGFALNLERLQILLDKIRIGVEYKSVDLIITNGECTSGELFRVAQRLRDNGSRVIQVPDLSNDDLIKYARSYNIDRGVIVDKGLIGSDEIYLIDCKKGSRKRINIKEI